MKISECFLSLQGEGPEIGHPTIFLRLSECNLINDNIGCEFCDSKWSQEGKEKLIKEVVEEIKKYHIKHVTITGGEPLLQELEIDKLMDALDKVGDYKISLETNGTIFTSLPFDTIIVSPKKQKINMQVLKQYSELDNVFFKFVYEKKDDRWWESIIFSLKLLNDKIYIMPEGKTRDEQLSKVDGVADYCVKNNYNMSLRLHVLIWNTRRGV